MIKIITTLITVTLFANLTVGQHDFEVNQQMVFQPLLNPASSTSYNDFSFCGYYRNQWTGFDGTPVSYGLSGLIPIEIIKGSIGLNILRDKIGARTEDELTAYYAYRAKLNNSFYLSFSLGGKVKMGSRNVSSLEVDEQGDNLISDYQNQTAFNSIFSTYLFSRYFYLGVIVPELLQNNHQASLGTVNTSFSINNPSLTVHIGKELHLKKTNHHLNLSTLVKTKGGTGVHSEFNIMYQILNKKIGIGCSYRTSKDIVGILKLSPIKELTISYGYQHSLGRISDFENGSHEVLLIYNMTQEKKVAKLYAPRF